MDPAPLRIEHLASEEAMAVQWEDGHGSRYPLRYLRGFCPCAQCQGHQLTGWTFNSVPRVELRAVEEVGRYAIRIRWADQHDTGIYSFEVLRELCPCQACQAAQGETHAMRRMPR